MKTHWWNNHTNKVLFTHWNKGSEDKYEWYWLCITGRSEEPWLEWFSLDRDLKERHKFITVKGLAVWTAFQAASPAYLKLWRIYNSEEIGGLECKERRLEKHFNLDHQSNRKLIERLGGCHYDHICIWKKRQCSTWTVETGLEWKQNMCFRNLAR